MDDDERLLRRAYDAFNARDVEAAIALMAPDVDWPNAWEGGRERGHAAVRLYWSRQFDQIHPQVHPESFEQAADGRVAVRVHQLVRDLGGSLLADGYVTHVYSIRDGLVTRMDVEEPAPGS